MEKDQTFRGDSMDNTIRKSIYFMTNPSDWMPSWILDENIILDDKYFDVVENIHLRA